MEEIPLDNADRKFLRKELGQHVFIYLVLLVLLSVMMGCFGLILEENVPEIYTSLIYPIFSLGYLGFVFFKLSAMIKELQVGVKHVKSGKITDKKMKVNYCWSGNPGVDLAIQPMVVEHYITLENEELCIDDKYYDVFHVSDVINIHYSTRTGKVLKITKG